MASFLKISMSLSRPGKALMTLALMTLAQMTLAQMTLAQMK